MYNIEKVRKQENDLFLNHEGIILTSTEFLRHIENIRGSKVITFVTADQVNSPFTAKMAMDTIPFIYEHLRNIGRPEKLDIFIYSQGGDTIVPWRIVTLAREHCKKLAVLIPYKAHSAATLLALGADEIIMGEMGELSPIDPSIGTPFNPKVNDQPGNPSIEISVEDVNGFFNYAKDRLDISSEDNMIDALGMLVEKLHPLALGSVYRSHALIRMMASKLLGLHMTQKTGNEEITIIVNNLAEKLYYHNYFIGRQEAKSLGLKVTYPDANLEEVMWNLYSIYKEEMGLGQTFEPGQYNASGAELTKPIALIESAGLRSSFTKTIKIKQAKAEKSGRMEISLQESITPWKTEKKVN